MSKRLTETQKQKNKQLRKQRSLLKKIEKTVREMEGSGYVFKKTAMKKVKVSSEKATLSQMKRRTGELKALNKTELYKKVKAYVVTTGEDYEKGLEGKTAVIRGNKQAVAVGKERVRAKKRKAKEEAKETSQSGGWNTEPGVFYDDYIVDLDEAMGRFLGILTTYELVSGADHFGRNGGSFKRHNVLVLRDQIKQAYENQRLSLRQNDVVAIKNILVVNDLKYRPRHAIYLRAAKAIYRYLTGSHVSSDLAIDDDDLSTIGTVYEADEEDQYEES